MISKLCLLAFILMTASMVALGYRRGFVKNLAFNISIIACIILAPLLHPLIFKVVEGTGLYDAIYNYLDGFIKTINVSGINATKAVPAASVAYVTKMIIRVMVYIISFAIIRIASGLLINTATIFTRMPVLKSIDKMLGGAFGLIKAFIVLWLIMFVCKFITVAEISKSIADIVNGNSFFKFMYNYNPLTLWLESKS